MRYFITIAYNGENYHGWQIQPNAKTIQEILEDRISKLLGNKISIYGAGRTDAGVHASKMVAHFDAEIIDKKKFLFRVNAFLPEDIAVHDIHEVKKDAHARFDAVKRTYHYYIHYKKNPFISNKSWYWNYQPLDLKLMNEVAKLLLKTKDFTSFAKLHTDNKTNICTVTEAIWSETNSGIIFKITADRFLRNMVRAVVGTLVDVGNGKINKDDFIQIIEQKDRKFASASAPAHGLFLADIKYTSDTYL